MMDDKDTEIRDIHINTEDTSKVDLFHHPIGKSKPDKVRDDRGVVITDASGNSKRTTGVILGYNKKVIELENGTYI